MLPKMGNRNYVPLEMGSKNYASQQSMVPINGPRSGGWQKSWVDRALDPVLDYGLHWKKPNKGVIVESSLTK